jgi:ADP-ribosyl-[dinitrogen reductase] hydrolase
MGTQALEELVDQAAAAGLVDEPALRSRYGGTLLGFAAGNAVGVQVEGESRHSIHRHHPGGLTEVDPRERDRPWDDDVAQTVIVGEALLRMEELSVDYLAGQLLQWRSENGRGIGVLTDGVLDEIARGTSASEAARRVWRRSGWSSAGNGAVMRCTPVALRWRSSGTRLVRAARACALATHFDARCVWSTVAYDVAVAIARSGQAVDLVELAGALERADEGGQDAAVLEQVVEAVRAVDGAELDDLDLDDPMDMGYTLKAMQVGLWACVQEAELEGLVVAVVGAGGDTDTNAALAGAAAGARAGETAVPRRWLERISGEKEITALADRLFESAAAAKA